VVSCIFVMLCTIPAAHSEPVVLSQPNQQRLGITTTTLVAVERKTQVAAFAKVLDPGPLAQLCSDLLAAESAAAASSAEARRATELHAADSTMSAKDTEAAIAQAKSDEAKRLLLRQRLGLEWGRGISRLADSKIKSLVDALSAGSAALIHVDTPSNEGQAGARTVDIDIGTDRLKGIVLGPARTAEPRLSSSGLLVEVTGTSSVLLSIGLTQSAHIDTGTPVKGVLVPREAVIRFRGSAWAYVKDSAEQFHRVLLQDGVPEDDGLFVSQGITAGSGVVMHGSAALFAIEQEQASLKPEK